MIPAYLEFKAIEKHYGKVTALAGIHLAVEEGATLALLGPNGAGKSTLFGCLLGLTYPTAGRITLRGALISDEVRTRMGYTAERVALYMHQTAWENGLFFAGLRGCSGDELEYQLHRVGLTNVRGRPVRQLSKGMLQRLGLAIALCGRPELLILDEPFNGLDPALLDNLCGILTEERERGATLLISTHTISAVEPLATHIAVLLEGRLAAFGTQEEVQMMHPEASSLEAIYHQIARQDRLEEVLV